MTTCGGTLQPVLKKKFNWDNVKFVVYGENTNKLIYIVHTSGQNSLFTGILLAQNKVCASRNFTLVFFYMILIFTLSQFLKPRKDCFERGNFDPFLTLAISKGIAIGY